MADLEAKAAFHGPLKKAGGRGKTVLGMSNLKVRYFVLSKEGTLSYFEDKKSWQAGSKALNDNPFDLKQCVIKFDLSKQAGSRRHPISVAPKSWQGGHKELDLEAESVAQRDEWRNSIRATLSMPAISSGEVPPLVPPLQRAESAQAASPPQPRLPAPSTPPPPGHQPGLRRAASSPVNVTSSSPRSPASRPRPTPREARTEVGALLRECRLEEYTHAIVTSERFEKVSDLKALGPSDFDELSDRVSLKLGQSRKLKKRLGMPVDLSSSGGGAMSPATSSRSISDGGSGGGGLGVNITGPPPPAPPVPLTEKEQEAWDMVARLKAEVEILKTKVPGGLTAAAGSSGSAQFGAGDLVIGKLLTSQIPVVVAVGEVTCATIAADAGEEDNAVRRVKFEEQDIGLDITVNAFGEPLLVSSVAMNGPAAKKGVEVGDLLIDANGASIPTDQPEAVLRDIFRKFKRPVTLGFYKLRKATELRRASEAGSGLLVRSVASPVTDAVTATTPPVVMVDGCPDADCNGTYTAQPHKIVNGIPRYLKNHSFYYLYRTTTGHWMITWFEPDIDEDKGEYRSEEQILTPELPSRWVGGTTGAESPGMVVYVRGSVPFARAP